MITIQHVSKSFGRLKVLKVVSLKFHSGQSVALVGPNGSGKTTLIKAILGLTHLDEGSIFVNGINVAQDYQYRTNVGYMPQINRFPDNMTVAQLFGMMKNLRVDCPPERYDSDLYTAFHIDALSRKPLGTLSGGMRQKVSAALAFLFRPEILILDEPTAALDPVSNEQLKSKIIQCMHEGRLALISSHILNELNDMVNHVVYLMDGEVLFHDSMSNLREETQETQLNKIIVTLIERHEDRV